MFVKSEGLGQRTLVKGISPRWVRKVVERRGRGTVRILLVKCLYQRIHRDV